MTIQQDLSTESIAGAAILRLVHVFSAPIAYLFRPHIVYPSREVAAEGELVGTAPRRHVW